MHQVIRFLLVGLVSGWIACILVRGTLRTRGCLTYMAVGIAGALIGGQVFRSLGVGPVVAVLTAAAGAIVLLALVGLVRRA
jgi:uncharacterized membrane protein YeaQ/YmgE (transglycosylase-associated protein family)